MNYIDCTNLLLDRFVVKTDLYYSERKDLKMSKARARLETKVRLHQAEVELQKSREAILSLVEYTKQVTNKINNQGAALQEMLAIRLALLNKGVINYDDIEQAKQEAINKAETTQHKTELDVDGEDTQLVQSGSEKGDRAEDTTGVS